MIELVLPNKKKTGSKILREKKNRLVISSGYKGCWHCTVTPQIVTSAILTVLPRMSNPRQMNHLLGVASKGTKQKYSDVPIDFPVIVDLGKMPKLKSFNPKTGRLVVHHAGDFQSDAGCLDQNPHLKPVYPDHWMCFF